MASRSSGGRAEETRDKTIQQGTTQEKSHVVTAEVAAVASRWINKSDRPRVSIQPKPPPLADSRHHSTRPAVSIVKT